MIYAHDEQYRPCAVVYGYGCEAPPALAGSNTRATCFKCGDSVCKRCSSVRTYNRFGRRRLCAYCQEELGMKFTFKG